MCLPHFLTGYNHIDTQVGFIYEQSLEEKPGGYWRVHKRGKGKTRSMRVRTTHEFAWGDLFTLYPMICIFQGACNSDGSRVVDWGGLIIMFLGVALTGARVLFDGSSLKMDFQILICPLSSSVYKPNIKSSIYKVKPSSKSISYEKGGRGVNMFHCSHTNILFTKPGGVIVLWDFFIKLIFLMMASLRP